MGDDQKIGFRVGVFVVSALLIGGALSFVIGNQRSVFRSKVEYSAVFDTVSGLRPGSPVRMAGVDIGTVQSVVLQSDGKIHVGLGIISDMVELVREDTVATVGNKGLLGDKLIDLTVGEGSPLSPGATLVTESPADFTDYLSRAGPILDSVEATVANLEQATAPFADERFAQDVQDLTHHLATITRMVAEEDGTVNRLLRDPETADQVEATLRNTRTLTAELSRSARSARAILDEVRGGDGSAHQLIYGEGGARLVDSSADAVSEVALALREIRTGDGMAHDIIYEREGQGIIDNLESATADVAAITSDVRAGRGTIGAFLTDPSVYEDVKRLVGDLERNEILRALVRYSITTDETGEGATVQDVEAP